MAASLWPRRLLVAVDASPLSQAAAAIATRLGASLGAAVEGLYVEDATLAGLVAHPEVTVVSLLHGRRHADGRILGAALKLSQTAAQRSFERASGSRVFHIRQGKVAAEMAAATTAEDLLVLGWHGRDAAKGSPRFGSVARALVEQARCPLLLIRHPLATSPRLAVLIGDAAALELARSLAGAAPVAILARAEDASAGHILVVRAAIEADGVGCSLLVLGR